MNNPVQVISFGCLAALCLLALTLPPSVAAQKHAALGLSGYYLVNLFLGVVAVAAILIAVDFMVRP